MDDYSRSLCTIKMRNQADTYIFPYNSVTILNFVSTSNAVYSMRIYSEKRLCHFFWVCASLVSLTSNEWVNILIVYIFICIISCLQDASQCGMTTATKGIACRFTWEWDCKILPDIVPFLRLAVCLNIVSHCHPLAIHECNNNFERIYTIFLEK